MRVRVLGCSGAIAKGCRTTSFLVDGDVLVDAGTGVGDLTLEEMAGIEHVLLTHSHLDRSAFMRCPAPSPRSRPMSSTTSSGRTSAASRRPRSRS